jgi:hypothetical protein
MQIFLEFIHKIYSRTIFEEFRNKVVITTKRLYIFGDESSIKAMC